MTAKAAALPKVLVVEDEPFIAESLKFLLRRQGYLVDHVDNGHLVLPRIREGKPDVVILDIMLPGADGFDVLQQIRRSAHGAHQKVMILTAKGQAQDRQRMRDLGADDFCTKPYSNQDLLDSVARLMDAPPRERQRETTRKAVVS